MHDSQGTAKVAHAMKKTDKRWCAGMNNNGSCASVRLFGSETYVAGDEEQVRLALPMEEARVLGARGELVLRPRGPARVPRVDPEGRRAHLSRELAEGHDLGHGGVIMDLELGSPESHVSCGGARRQERLRGHVGERQRVAKRRVVPRKWLLNLPALGPCPCGNRNRLRRSPSFPASRPVSCPRTFPCGERSDELEFTICAANGQIRRK